MTAPLRLCARCHSEKPVEAFPIRDQARGTRRAYCLPCCREYGREHYRRNRPAYLGRTRTRNASVRLGHREFVLEYFRTHPCVDCGIADPVVLEFDHRDPITKSANVGKLIGSGSFDDLKAEIVKCDVRCGNCHRRKTLLQFPSYRALMAAARAY
jgi:hypothetical protein